MRMQGIGGRLARISCVLFALLLAGCYDYQKDRKGRDSRMNKLTGNLEVLLPDGKWKTPEQIEAASKAEAEAAANAKRQNLPYSEAAKVTTRGGYSWNMLKNFECTINNGSDWVVSEMDIVVIIKDSTSSNTIDTCRGTIICESGDFYSREYYILPHQEKTCSVRLDRAPEAGQYNDWNISVIRGFPRH